MMRPKTKEEKARYALTVRACQAHLHRESAEGRVHVAGWGLAAAGVFIERPFSAGGALVLGYIRWDDLEAAIAEGVIRDEWLFPSVAEAELRSRRAERG